MKNKEINFKGQQVGGERSAAECKVFKIVDSNVTSWFREFLESSETSLNLCFVVEYDNSSWYFSEKNRPKFPIFFLLLPRNHVTRV